MPSLETLVKPIFSLSRLCCLQRLPPPGSSWRREGDGGAEPSPGPVTSRSAVGASSGSRAKAGSFSGVVLLWDVGHLPPTPGPQAPPSLPTPTFLSLAYLTAALRWGLLTLAGVSVGGWPRGATFSITRSAPGKLNPFPRRALEVWAVPTTAASDLSSHL